MSDISRTRLLPASGHLLISERFDQIAAAPILHLHRHRDGYIAFATKRDGDDFRPLVSIRASELETWFPAFRTELEKDSYVSINADWRLRKYGPNGDAYGYPLHNSKALRFINACYVDIDLHKLCLDLGTVIGRVINLQESGQLPHASMIVRSGHGVYRCGNRQQPSSVPGAPLAVPRFGFRVRPSRRTLSPSPARRVRGPVT